MRIWVLLVFTVVIPGMAHATNWARLFRKMNLNDSVVRNYEKGASVFSRVEKKTEYAVKDGKRVVVRESEHLILTNNTSLSLAEIKGAPIGYDLPDKNTAHLFAVDDAGNVTRYNFSRQGAEFKAVSFEILPREAAELVVKKFEPKIKVVPAGGAAASRGVKIDPQNSAR